MPTCSWATTGSWGDRKYSPALTEREGREEPTFLQDHASTTKPGWYLPSGLISLSVYSSSGLSLLHCPALLSNIKLFNSLPSYNSLNHTNLLSPGTCQLAIALTLSQTPAVRSLFIKALTIFPTLPHKTLLFPSCYYCGIQAWVQPQISFQRLFLTAPPTCFVAITCRARVTLYVPSYSQARVQLQVSTPDQQ